MAEQTITYIGATSVLTGLGFGTEANYNSIMLYKSGIKPQPLMPDGTLIPAQTIANDLIPDADKSLTRLERMMYSVANDVVAQSGVKPDSRLGIVFSTTKGNIAELNTSVPDNKSRVFLSVLAHNVCQKLGIGEEPVVVSNACISGVAAVSVASRLIRAGRYDNVIVVGADEATPFVVSGFVGFKSVSPTICRPYDKHRDGLSMGEAAGAILVTRHRALSRGVAVEGSAMTNDANHISGPSRTGEPLSAAINEALSQSGLAPDDISFVNAHGTATLYNDEMESKALTLSGLNSKPLNSLKPYFGHTLGASGVIEIAMCVEQMRNSLIFGTMGFEEIGTPHPLNVSAKHREAQTNHCLKIASGFGGCNAAIVLSVEAKARAVEQKTPADFSILHSCKIADGRVTVDNQTVITTTEDFDKFVREVYHFVNEPNIKFFKMDDLCKLGYLAAHFVLQGVDYKADEVAIVLSNRSSSLDTDLRHEQTLAAGQPASPAIFVYTLANIVMGEICIKNHIQGETTFFISDKYEKAKIERYAQFLLTSGRYKYVIFGWCEYLNKKYNVDIQLITTK